MGASSKKKEFNIILLIPSLSKEKKKGLKQRKEGKAGFFRRELRTRCKRVGGQ